MKRKTITTIAFSGSVLLLLACSETSVTEKKAAAINLTATTGSTTSSPHQGSTTGHGRTMQDLTEVMHNNMKEVNQITMTGDPDYDFASMMSVHNKGGIEMADMEINKGQDKELVKLAKSLKKEQEKEMKELNKYTSENKAGSPDKTCMEDMKTCKEKCMSEMGKMSMSGNIDNDFANMMSSHQKHGIKMAKIEDKCGKDEKMKSVAQKIIRDQEKDIQELQPYTKK
jgi:uncharacterized protein (DUF305 family)